MARPSSSPSPVLAHAAALAAALSGSLAAQHEQGAADPNAPMYVAPRSAAAQEAIAGFQLAETLVCDLVASEPDLANPVAFAIDGKGRVYVAETFRIKDGVFDDRDYMQWKDDDLACRTVADGTPRARSEVNGIAPRGSGAQGANGCSRQAAGPARVYEVDDLPPALALRLSPISWVTRAFTGCQACGAPDTSRLLGSVLAANLPRSEANNRCGRALLPGKAPNTELRSRYRRERICRSMGVESNTCP